MRALAALFARDVRLSVKAGGGAPMGVLFFLAVVTLMPFSIGPDLPLLARIGPAVLWIGALLATLLGLDRMFQVDQEDGTIDVLLTGGHALELVVLVKAAAHWVSTSLPLVIAAPFMGLLLNMDATAIGAVTLTLLVGTPALAGGQEQGGQIEQMVEPEGGQRAQNAMFAPTVSWVFTASR